MLNFIVRGAARVGHTLNKQGPKASKAIKTSTSDIANAYRVGSELAKRGKDLPTKKSKDATQRPDFENMTDAELDAYLAS